MRKLTECILKRQVNHSINNDRLCNLRRLTSRGDKGLGVRYRENPKDLKSEDFCVKMEMNETGTLAFGSTELLTRFAARKFTLNELGKTSTGKNLKMLLQRWRILKLR